MISLESVAPPAAEPVTLAEMKAHARIDTDADDALIGSLVTAARQWAEQYTGRAFITQTWRMWRDNSPDGYFFTLPKPPLVSVTEFRIMDDGGEGEVWPEQNYFVDKYHEPGRLALRSGSAWPAERRFVNNYAIEFTAGYGNAAEDVPEAIRLAIKQLAAHWYENRGETILISPQNTERVPLVIQALLDPYRIRGMWT